jgi:hypothetical protein
MPTPTYTPLATVTLGSATASVVFSSIPATYRDIVIIFDGATTVSDGVGARFNGDTGNNYSAVRMTGSSAGAISDSFSGISRIIQTAGDVDMFVSQVMDYSATDKHKTVLTRSSISTNVTGIAARWANTAAITSITVFSPGSTMTTGTTISLYGVIA